MDDSTANPEQHKSTPDRLLHSVELRAGKPPRPANWPGLASSRARRPPWVPDDDALVRLFLMQDQIVRNGQVRWAHVVHANTTLFEPGPVDHGAQVVYAPQGDVPLPSLKRIAHRLFALKGTQPDDPAERKLADMLTDEYERALDWPAPPSLTDGKNVVTTIVILPRRHMPGRLLAMSYFPILADPKSLLAAYVPAQFWPEELRNQWQARAERIQQDFLFRAGMNANGDDEDDDVVERPIVELTEAAAAMLRRHIDRSGLAEARLYVGVRIGMQGEVTQLMEFTGQPNDKTQLSFASRGIPMVIDAAHVTSLAGTVIDYRGKLGSGVFVFNNPNFEFRDA